jgi:hypothetical protein
MGEIAQVIAEILLQLFFEVFADALWRRLPASIRFAVHIAATLAVALLFGWLSTRLFPNSFISWEWLRIAYLVIAPVFVGLVMSKIGSYFTARNKRRSALEDFGFGWLFAFTFALARHHFAV